jgi:hypothetical protein
MLLCGGTAAQMSAQQIPKSNVTVLQELTRAIVTDSILLSALPSGVPLVLKIPQTQDSWIVRQSAIEVFTDHGYQVYSDSIIGEGDYTAVNLVPTQLLVVYGETFQHGLFTTRYTQRQCSVNINIEIMHQPSNKVLLSKSFQQTFADTIPLSLIPTVEHNNIASTKGTSIGGSFVDRIAEPLVIIGTVGIAIVLFFVVRNQ